MVIIAVAWTLPGFCVLPDRPGRVGFKVLSRRSAAHRLTRRGEVILSSGGWGKKGAAFRAAPVIQTWQAALMGKIGKSPLSDQEAAAVTPVQVPAHTELRSKGYLL